ncbi:MAG TPA: hypothetical protein VK875_07790 [Euzebyales bacterium]|nr:hypothetical protein [Euzebyales bacterium]
METLFSLTVLALPLFARWLAEAAQRQGRRRSWGQFDPGPSLDALRGYKIAQLIVGRDDTAWLAGVTSLRYGVDTLARCRRRACTPPGLDCRCGFYAFRDRAQALDLLGRLGTRHPARSYVLLTVDLDGAVLEYEAGFRAQRQRVLRIDVPDACMRCLRNGTVRPVATFMAHPQFRGEQLLYERTLLARLALPQGSAPVRPLCEEHVPPDSAPWRMDLGALRRLLATEVALLPDADMPFPRTAG